MTLKAKVLDTWTRKNGLEVGGLLAKTGKGILNNNLYQTPPHIPADLTAQGILVIDAYNKRKADKDNYDNVLADSYKMLTETAEYVTNNCGGIAANVHSAGFESTAIECTPAVLPGQAVIKDVASKNGIVSVLIEKMAGVNEHNIIVFAGAEAAVTLSNNNQINIAAGAAALSIITQLARVFSTRAEYLWASRPCKV